MKTTASTTRTMANQCRAANRRARPPEGLVSGTPLDMTRTIVRRRVFTGTFRYQFAFGLSDPRRPVEQAAPFGQRQPVCDGATLAAPGDVPARHCGQLYWSGNLTHNGGIHGGRGPGVPGHRRQRGFRLPYTLSGGWKVRPGARGPHPGQGCGSAGLSAPVLGASGPTLPGMGLARGRQHDPAVLPGDHRHPGCLSLANSGRANGAFRRAAGSNDPIGGSGEAEPEMLTTQPLRPTGQLVGVNDDRDVVIPVEVVQPILHNVRSLIPTRSTAHSAAFSRYCR